ncbi:MAG: TIGR02186 family protein [Desulfurivibrionaceae bacterium]
MKRTLMNSSRYLAVAAIVLLGLAILPVPAVQALTCSVTPDNIPITFTYHGAQLSITGQSASTDDLVVTITSEPADTALKYKEKVGGLVWMKKGTLEFKDAPRIYLLHSTADLSRILGVADLNQHLLGYDALRGHIRIEDSAGNPADGKWFDEYLKFKQQEKVYDIQEGTVVRQHGEDGNTYKVDVAWPYQAPPGIYTVEVLAVRDGKVVDRASTHLEVKSTGMVAALSKMAFDQAGLYGIMAVVIALLAGLAVGAIFKKGGGSH